MVASKGDLGLSVMLLNAMKKRTRHWGVKGLPKQGNVVDIGKK